MKCQHCQNREAVVSLNIILNQHKKNKSLYVIPAFTI